ncbi:MAG: tetratricopeptide repeat protein, partial [Pseudomonadota bacterium]
DQTIAAAEMLDAAEQTGGGYAGLARLRAAAFLVQDGDIDGANAALTTIAQDDSLPDRLRDLARLRAASLVLDNDPARATALAGEVTTDAMVPFADEIRALAALSAGDYEAAYAGFTRLVDQGSALAIPAVAERARLMAPVADAARRGVSLEPQESEADAFIRSFTDQLDQELSAPADENTVPEEVPEEDGAEGNETN